MAFVLIHSPSVGPATWEAVAERLRGAGHDVVVPSLVDIAVGGPPYWPRVVEAVGAAVGDRERVVLVAHSNAGLFVPVLCDPTVVGCVFVDAGLPARDGTTPVAPAGLLEFLSGLAVDGVLPQWTSWWDEADVAPMFTDPRVRARVEAEQPRLPLDYYRQRLPVPAGWDRRPCGYLVFAEAYAAQYREAASRGWTVASLPGEHLHQIVDPDAVASVIIQMASAWL